MIDYDDIPIEEKSTALKPKAPTSTVVLTDNNYGPTINTVSTDLITNLIYSEYCMYMY